MSAEALSPDQFRFTQATPKAMSDLGAAPDALGHPMHNIRLTHHRLDAFSGPTQAHVGTLLWSHKTGEIGNIGVPEQFQRRGIATAMWQEAHRIAGETRGVKPPRHSPQRTNAGEAWARSLGKRLPKRSQ